MAAAGCQIFDTFKAVKGYLAFTYLINYQYIGVPWDAPDDLFWNFEYLTSWLFGMQLTAALKKVLQLSDIGYKEFWPINKYKCVK